MNDAFTVNTTVQYTPPSAASNSGLATLATSGTENAQSVGKLDILSSITPGDVVAIPFGAVDAAKVCIVRNLMSTEVGIRLNGAVANDFTLGPGQKFQIDGAIAGTTTPLVSVDVELIAAPSATEFVQYWVVGD